jgi:hypothetical protein
VELLGKDTLEVLRLGTVPMQVCNQAVVVVALGVPVLPEPPVWVEREGQVLLTQSVELRLSTAVVVVAASEPQAMWVPAAQAVVARAG